MALLKLYQVATPTSATQVSSTNQPVVQVVISNSGANSTSVGDKTMTTAGTGVVIPSGQTLTIGSAQGRMSFDITELYVIAGTGNVNVLATCL
jgi:hypothetical protein